MCDYSLHAVASRPAKVGDKLLTTAFPFTTTRGFTETGAPSVAICLRAGTEVAFDQDVRYERNSWGLRRSDTIAQRVARFREMNPYSPTQYHDALEFPDGQTVLVTQLTPGQRATVLQLPIGEVRPAGEQTVTSSEAAPDFRRTQPVS
jgi:hypothetical protein